jgi:hypothetical protein
MKRISEVFELPLSQLPEADDQVQDANGDWALVVKLPWRTDYVVNALNNTDALADALESLTSDYARYKAVNGIDLTDDHSAALDVKMNQAFAVLAAYRGEK